jgi:hypothetical protein
VSATLYRFTYDGTATLVVDSWSIFGVTWGSATANNADARVDSLVMDAAGKLWMHRRGGYLHRVSVATGSPVFEVQVAVSAVQTTFSNQRLGGRNVATLSGSLGALTGTWGAVHDAGGPALWSLISWTESEPLTTSLAVEWRAATTLPNLALGSWTSATTPSGSVMGVLGQYVEVRVSFDRPTVGTGSPLLLDLTITGELVAGGGGGGPQIIHPSAQQRAVAQGFGEDPGQPNILILAPGGMGRECLRQWALEVDLPALPWIESLLQRATRYTGAQSQATPAGTLASLLFGTHAHNTGVGASVLEGNRPAYVTATSLPQYLRSAYPEIGHRFGYFGWWPLAHEERWDHPRLFGFDEWDGTFEAVQYPDRWVTSDGRLIRDHFPEWTLERTRAFILDADQRRALFFAIASLGLPGEMPFYPVRSRAAFLEAMVELDRLIGEFMGRIPQGILANTEVVFWPLSPTPADLRGPTYVNGSPSIPLLIGGPVCVLPGRENASLIAPFDLFGTVVKMIGTSVIPDDTISFLRTLTSTNSNSTRVDVMLEAFEPNGEHLGATTPGVRSIQNASYKLVRRSPGTTFPDALDEFYDLLADPTESSNLTPGGATGGLSAGQLSAYNTLKASYTTQANT